MGPFSVEPSRRYKQCVAADLPLDCHACGGAPVRRVRPISSGVLVVNSADPIEGEPADIAIEVLAGERLELTICRVVSWSGAGPILLMW